MGEQSQFESQMTQTGDLGRSGFTSTTTGGEQEGSDTKGSLVAIIFCLVLVGLVGMVAYLLLGSEGTDDVENTDDESSSGGGGGNGGGGGGGGGGPPPPYPAPPPTPPGGPTGGTLFPSSLPTPTPGPIVFSTTGPVIPTQPVPTTTSTTQSTTSTTTTSTPAPIKELICTVGYSAVVRSMYPPDQYCDFLFYTEVVVTGSDRIEGAKLNTSWGMFQNMSSTYRNVKPGVAFDFRRITVDKLNSVTASLNRLAQNNIKHYGLLNVVTRVQDLDKTLRSLKQVLERMKQLQGNDARRKTFIAIGLQDYSPPSAFDTYSSQIKDVAQNYKADTVIAISSSGWQDNITDCYAVPPVALQSRNPRFPSVKKQAELVRAGFCNPQAVVGLSYQLGALTYLLMDDAFNATTMPYAKCRGGGTTSMDSICELAKPLPVEGVMSKKSIHAFGGYLKRNDKSLVFLTEYSLTFSSMWTALPRNTFRNRIAWLVFDVHLEDHTGKCFSTKFDLLKGLCRSFKHDGRQAC